MLRSPAMNRTIAVTAAIVASIWMLLPAVEYSATEMGFQPGEPDPNLYRTSLALGEPLPWIIAEWDQQESESRRETRVRSFSVFHFILHLTFIAAPIWFYRRIGRKRAPNSTPQYREPVATDTET